jgi:glycosyltransferase involved in cell wall biosynthesis
VEWRLEYVPEAEVGALFAGADLVVFPYRQVDASGALMLALPFGVPVVASRIGVFRELLEHGVTGLLATPGDDKDLAIVLTRALRDDDLRATLRQNLAQRVRSVWSWSEIARAHLGIYERHLQRLAQATAGGWAAQPGSAPTARDISLATER